LAVVVIAAFGVAATSAARDVFAPDVLSVQSTYERVTRDGETVELIGKLAITNDGTGEVDLQGKMVRLRFPGLVKIAGDGFDSQTKAGAADWDTSVCYWSFVRGRYNGTNVCPGIERRITADALEVRFLTGLKLCAGCVLRGDSEGRSFGIKHIKYYPIVVDSSLLQPIGPVVPVSNVVSVAPPPPPRKREVCFPPEVDFSFVVQSFPSRVDRSVRLGEPGYDAFLRVKVDIRNRGAVDYDMTNVVINLPFDFTINPNVGGEGIKQDPDQFFTRCYGAICDRSKMTLSPARDAFQIRFREKFNLCPGCKLQGSGLDDEVAFEIYSPFLFPLNIESVRGASAFCE